VTIQGGGTKAQAAYQQRTTLLPQRDWRACERSRGRLVERVPTVHLQTTTSWGLGGDKPTEGDGTVYTFIVVALVADPGLESK
jgi:hypothetical protein